MKSFKLSDMLKGWFIGDFYPTLHRTSSVEIAVKKYLKGEYEKKHFHKIAIEYTVIISGQVKMNEDIYYEGDIIVIEPNESTDFLALTDVVTTVVKMPSAINDKYED